MSAHKSNLQETNQPIGQRDAGQCLANVAIGCIRTPSGRAEYADLYRGIRLTSALNSNTAYIVHVAGYISSDNPVTVRQGVVSRNAPQPLGVLSPLCFVTPSFFVTSTLDKLARTLQLFDPDNVRCRTVAGNRTRHNSLPHILFLGHDPRRA